MIQDLSEKRQVAIGRYLLHRQIARGGMATIHIARLMGDEGFSRIVAAKRLLPEFAEDTEFVAMFMDEARIASKVHHPNVVPVLDLVTTSDEVMLVQEYVHGVPLHVLLRTAHDSGRKIPVRIACSIATQVLAGLHAAHTTVDEMGVPLGIIHRDVSPQNVMIAVDGSARLLDFGVAKATMAAHVTRDGTFKGKLAYSAPEQVRGRPVQQSDVYALSVVLWELLVGHRMHATAQGEAELVATIMGGNLRSVTEALSNESDWGSIDSDEWRHLSAIEPVVEKGLSVDVARRYRSAAELEREIAKAVAPATASEVAEWVRTLGKDFIEGRDKIIAAEEASWRRSAPPQLHRTPVRTMETSNPRNPTHPFPPSELRSVVPVNPRTMRLALAGLVVLVLAIVVIWAVKPSSRAAAKPAATAGPPPSAAPAPIREVTVERPQPTKPAPLVTEDTRGEPAEEPAPVAAAPAPAVKPRRAASRPVPRVVAKKVEPPPSAPPAVAVPDAKNDCNPPYYYEGSKKVFKPNCL